MTYLHLCIEPNKSISRKHYPAGRETPKVEESKGQLDSIDAGSSLLRIISYLPVCCSGIAANASEIVLNFPLPSFATTTFGVNFGPRFPFNILLSS